MSGWSSSGEPPLPASLSAELAGYDLERDTVGESGASVYRLFGKAGSPDLFLKHGQGTVADDVTDEMARLLWLAPHVPVPAVVQFVRTCDQAWLLTTAIQGKTAYRMLEECPATRRATVDALAVFLRRWHAIPVRGCPFNSDHGLRLARGRARVDAGLVEMAEFDSVREGWTAQQVWEALQAHLPLLPDPVVTHGDFSLDNLLFAMARSSAASMSGGLGSPIATRTSPSSGTASVSSTRPCRTGYSLDMAFPTRTARSCDFT